ncbi:TPA: hypothetical protein ENS27_16150 [bacterium]|nr:hypothetical protein [bacterium]
MLGALPDLLSIIFLESRKVDKWSHRHRDNFTHSIFFLFLILFTLACHDHRMAIVASTAVLSHPLIDLFGIGWGVKLFYPLSRIQV